MKRRHDESGQAFVLTVVFLTALLGMAALVLDVGSWFREQRALQATADAAALAAAQALPGATGEARLLAEEYVTKNGGGTADVTFSSVLGPDDTIRVKVSRQAPGFFARIFGVDTVDVGASAVARTSGIRSARWAAPITVNEHHPLLNCDGQPQVPCFEETTTLDLIDLHSPGSGDASGSFGLINLDQSDSGSVGSDLLAEWVGYGLDAYMPIGEYTSVPSAKFNDSQFKNALRDKEGEVLLFPIYRSITGEGSTAVFDVIGWVGFLVESFHARGSSGTVTGQFTEVLWEGIQTGSAGGGPDFGVKAVQLVE